MYNNLFIVISNFKTYHFQKEMKRKINKVEQIREKLLKNEN